MTISLIRFDRDPPPAESGKPERILAGAPETRTRNFYSDGQGKFFAGIWESTPGKWRILYEEDEFCHLLAGRIVITDESGHAETFAAGDAFVIPRGFAGTWETIESVRKYYAIRLA